MIHDDPSSAQAAGEPKKGQRLTGTDAVDDVTRREVYDLLRAYQDRKFEHGCLRVGILDAGLSTLMSRICELIAKTRGEGA